MKLKLVDKKFILLIRYWAGRGILILPDQISLAGQEKGCSDQDWGRNSLYTKGY